MSAAIDLERLAAALVQRGHLAPDAPPPREAAASRPWFVGLVLGIAGWLAGIFGVVFVFLVFEPEGAGSMTIIGVVLLAAAFALYLVDRDSAFFDQLALSLSIAGQLGIAGAIGHATDWEPTPTAALIAVAQSILVVAMPNPLARFLSTFFACIAWAFAIRTGWWSTSFLNIERASVPLLPALLSWLAIWVPIAALAALLISREAAWMASALRSLLRPMLTGLLVALAFGGFVTAPWDVLAGQPSPGGGQVNWLVIWPLLSMVAAMLAALWAQRVRHAALIGAAGVAAFLHVVMFYYLLGTTLLIKSCIMLAVGVVMVGAGALFRTKPVAGTREAT